MVQEVRNDAVEAVRHGETIERHEFWTPQQHAWGAGRNHIRPACERRADQLVGIG